MRSSNTTAPADLDLLDVIVLIGQVRLDILHAALSKVDADQALLVSRVQNDGNVGTVFVQVRGAVEFIIADADAVGIGADEAGEVCERPGALGNLVLAVFDFDELLVVVVVCGFVLDDKPPNLGLVGFINRGLVL